MLQLLKDEGTAKKAAKDAKTALDIGTLKKYDELSELDVKHLVFDDKWQAVGVAVSPGKLYR